MVSRSSESSIVRKSDISLPISSVTTNQHIEDTIPIAKAIEQETNSAVIKRRKQKTPTTQEIDVMSQLKDICFSMNPNEIYKDMTKIGQG